MEGELLIAKDKQFQSFVAATVDTQSCSPFSLDLGTARLQCTQNEWMWDKQDSIQVFLSPIFFFGSYKNEPDYTLSPLTAPPACREPNRWETMAPENTIIDCLVNL